MTVKNYFRMSLTMFLVFLAIVSVANAQYSGGTLAGGDCTNLTGCFEGLKYE